jgi:hypothetical protein
VAAFQLKLDSDYLELMYIDEFAINDRGFKFYGWGVKGETGYIQSIAGTFSMTFFIDFSKEKFY